MTKKLRLGVNIDHVATIRNARGGLHPDPVRAAKEAVKAGADGITAHLREDRRHISDHDIRRLRREVPLPLNLEMAATGEMLSIALEHVPNACCIVPEKREEVTTEGGLNVKGQQAHLKAYIGALKAKGIRVSLFIDPDKDQVKAAAGLGADIIELHTGRYCDTRGEERKRELVLLQKTAKYGDFLGLEIHAGHGLSFETVKP
ncbi:MAG TPA: pyridoxine 5'-phosphate synthase, partial [Sphingomonadales bacterium]|nr:pyridoxine 5'-phosphate synthase [Sphingomonadales bacterium]